MSGRYKAYGEYKESGVDSIGFIPQNWSFLRLKYITEIKKRIAGELGYDVLSVTQKGIVIKDIVSGEGQLSMDYSKYQIVNPGEFAMNHMDLLTGYVDISKYNGVTSPDYRVFSISNDRGFYSRYYLYLLQDGYKQRRFFHLGQGSAHLGRWRLPTEAFNEICYPFPSFAEQTQIAAFLDHETAKMDTLIDKQQQLIELLKEKRQAVISHAVTKGLDPDVPMKDSGVEWLGEVPEHWKVLAIKKIVSTPITDGPHETPNFIEEGVSFISAEAISSGVIDFSKQRACISIKDHIRFSEKYKPHLYDIYMVKSGATTGVSAIVETINDFNIWSPLAAIRCSEIAFPYFVLYFLRSQQFLTAIELNWSFGTQQNIGMGVIGNIYISCPPIKEAIMISDHIRQKCSKIENLITLATHQISLIQERRTALISAAVTGKIDVRDWQVPVTQTESDEVMA